MNEYLPTVVVFGAVVVGVAYAPVPVWFKVLVVLSGLVMMLISAAALSNLHDGKAKEGKN